MKCSKRNKIIAAVITIALTAITIVSLNHTDQVLNPPVTGEIRAPSSVKQIFERSCYSCHSNETKLKWYDQLPFVSSLVSHDITEARKRFNFSTWDSLSPTDQKGTLWEIYNMLNAGKMPLKSYTAIHPEAKVSKADLSVIKNYLNTLKVSHISDTAKVNEAALQYTEWQRLKSADYTPAKVDHNTEKAAENLAESTDDLQLNNNLPVAVNGIKHMPEYRNWQVLSTTSRFDNGTIRVMYANPIAIQAVKEGNINPWPKGAVIVKVVWEKLEDKTGNVKPGKFINIQYMVRDSEKFKATEGWGFARFDTPKLKAYGTLISFKKCIACHQAVKKTGFVFDLSTKINHDKL